MRALHASLTLCLAMIIRMRTLIVSGVLLLTAGFGAAGNAQMGPGPGGPSGPRPGRDSNMGPATSGREFVPPANFRSPANQDWPPLGGFRGARTPGPNAPPNTAKSVPLSDVVSTVQQQFNATAVKADTFSEDGQLVYRIRLMSADKSRVWTVNVDARTGQLR
jgi:hypothetical protein